MDINYKTFFNIFLPYSAMDSNASKYLYDSSNYYVESDRFKTKDLIKRKIILKK